MLRELDQIVQESLPEVPGGAEEEGMMLPDVPTDRIPGQGYTHTMSGTHCRSLLCQHTGFDSFSRSGLHNTYRVHCTQSSTYHR